jgi:hypothetical protein
MKKQSSPQQGPHVKAVWCYVLSVVAAVLCFWPALAAAQGGPPPKAKADIAASPATLLPKLFDDGVGAGLAWAKKFEFVQMFDAIMGGSMMGPGDGWFHPSRTKYGWTWLAYHFDKNHDGKITLAEFGGPPSVFKKLDRNGDGVLTAEDFEWMIKMPPDFTLKTHEGKQTVSLGQFRHQKPVVLIFGSFT